MKRLAAAAGLMGLVALGLPISANATIAQIFPNDPCFNGCGAGTAHATAKGVLSPMPAGQWNLAQVKMPQAWEITKGSADIEVAVIDSGMHTSVDDPDMTGQVIQGPDFVPKSKTPAAIEHGDAVASVISAHADNGYGIAGLGWNTKVLSIRALSDDRVSEQTDPVDALRYAATQPAVRVINLSWGCSADNQAADPTLKSAVAYAQSKGKLVVASAGNDGTVFSSACDPAGYPGVLSVAGTTQSDAIASWSTHGPNISLAAPGENIPVWMDGGWQDESGTSFAAPEVAAAAALLFAKDPTLDAATVAGRLINSSDKIAGSGTLVASGRLNVLKALNSTWASADGDPATPFKGHSGFGIQTNSVPTTAKPTTTTSPKGPTTTVAPPANLVDAPSVGTDQSTGSDPTPVATRESTDGTIITVVFGGFSLIAFAVAGFALIRMRQ